MKARLLRVTTVPISLAVLLRGQLHFYSQNGFEVLAVSADGKEVDSIVREGIRHSVVSMTRAITPLRDLLAILHMVTVIRKFRPDIIHTHTPKAGLVGMLAAWLCQVPVRLHTVAGLPLMEARGAKRTLLILVEKITYACATNVYPNSARLAEYINENIFSSRKLRIIGNGSTNGIDINYFRPSEDLSAKAKEIRREMDILSDDVVFSFAGRIVKDKGIRELVAAFRKILASVRSDSARVKLLLIGSFEQELDPLTADDLHFLQTSEHVVLAGFQSDVRPWIMASDIFVFPSYREGFPNVVMQACCLEVPCIVSNINGCNEIIVDQSTGLIVPVKETEKLFHAMLDLLNNAGKRKQFALRAQDYVRKYFDQQFIWDELLKEYHTQLAKRGILSRT